MGLPIPGSFNTIIIYTANGNILHSGCPCDINAKIIVYLFDVAFAVVVQEIL